MLLLKPTTEKEKRYSCYTSYLKVRPKIPNFHEIKWHFCWKEHEHGIRCCLLESYDIRQIVWFNRSGKILEFRGNLMKGKSPKTFQEPIGTLILPKEVQRNKDRLELFDCKVEELIQSIPDEEMLSECDEFETASAKNCDSENVIPTNECLPPQGAS